MNNKAKISLVISLFLALAVAITIVLAQPPLKECRDNVDNDGDGAIDWPADAGCSNKNDDDETNCGDGICEGGETTGSCPIDCLAQCGDGIDNDGDGHIDTALNGDSECADATDNDESPRDFCNDSDGFNLYVQGTVSGEDDSVPFSYTDFCLDSNFLREHYCGSKNLDYDPLTIDYNCFVNGTGNCLNGRCI